MTLEKQARSETTVNVRRLPGLTPYAEAWDLQKDLVRLRKNDEIPDTFVLCEHPPVYTVGRAAKDAGNLGAGEEYLPRSGSDRGVPDPAPRSP
jgi:lipoyl(octanoyl) transferase